MFYNIETPDFGSIFRLGRLNPSVITEGSRGEGYIVPGNHQPSSITPKPFEISRIFLTRHKIGMGT